MRLGVHQRNSAIIRADAQRFFEMVRAHFSDGKTLLHRPSQSAEETERIFSRSEPIRSLAKIAEVNQLHVAVKSLEKLRPDLQMVIHEKQHRQNIISTRPKTDHL